MHITFVKNDVTKEVKVGFSWTTFLLGGLPQIFTRQGEFLVGLLVFVTSCFFSWFPALVYGFFANKRTARKLMENGWKPINQDNPQVNQALLKWQTS